MFMKTKGKYKKSLIRVVQTTGSEVCGFSMVDGTGRGHKHGGPRYQNRRNKARMLLKTKERHVS